MKSSCSFYQSDIPLTMPTTTFFSFEHRFWLEKNAQLIMNGKSTRNEALFFRFRRIQFNFRVQFECQFMFSISYNSKNVKIPGKRSSISHFNKGGECFFLLTILSAI